MADDVNMQTSSPEGSPAEGAPAAAQASQETQAKQPQKSARRKTAKAAQQDQNLEQSGQLLFEKYNVNELAVGDPSLTAYIKMSRKAYPNLFGRRKYKAYYLSHVDVVERLISKLMRGGTGKKISGKVIRRKGSLQGKKLKVTHIVEEAFDSIQKKTNRNPVQVLLEALQNAAPIEDTTRVRYGGISYNVAVGISSQRRLDVALRNVALAGLMSSFKNRKTLAEALSNEIILAAGNSPDSYAVKKRIEVERIAKRAR